MEKVEPKIWTVDVQQNRKCTIEFEELIGALE